MEPVLNDLNPQNAPAVMLGTITHNGQLEGQMAQAFYSHASQRHTVYNKAYPTSLLAAGCNRLWCEAINMQREMKWRYFALLHSDIVPELFWLDKLIALADQYDADIMSAIVPIKDDFGLTSTAVSRPTYSHNSTYSCWTRLTQQQVNDPAMPETFDIDMLREAMPNLKGALTLPDHVRLLVNTGCVVIRCDREWAPKAHFTINDHLVIGVHGLQYEVEPEDWYFSRRVAEMGGRVMATRAVKLAHVGKYDFKSTNQWGHRLDPNTIPV